MIGRDAVGLARETPSFSDYFEAEAFVESTVSQDGGGRN